MRTPFLRLALLSLFAASSLGSEEVRPRNVILAIGDGMGFNHVIAGRIHKGDFRQPLVMEQLPVSGILDTRSIGADPITDSAASATAMATGQKTENGRIATLPDGSSLPTLFETLKAKNYRTGIVTNGSLNGATAAAFTAHAADRDEKATIARQLIALQPDFLYGASDDLFYPDLKPPITPQGMRSAGWNLAIDQPLNSLQISDEPTCLAYSEIIREEASVLQRKNVYAPNAPSLQDALELSLKHLPRADRGFFLLLEDDWIDSWSHEGQFELLANSVSDFDDAIASALAFAQRDQETLLIVTADHECGGLTLTHLSDQAATAHFSTEEHTAALVPLYAFGPGASHFSGTLDNTDIHKILSQLLQLD